VENQQSEAPKLYFGGVQIEEDEFGRWVATSYPFDFMAWDGAQPEDPAAPWSWWVGNTAAGEEDPVLASGDSATLLDATVEATDAAFELVGNLWRWLDEMRTPKGEVYGGKR
jgi:hypothetical protein